MSQDLNPDEVEIIQELDGNEPNEDLDDNGPNEEIDEDMEEDGEEAGNERSDAITSLEGHEQSVLCCDLSNNDKYAVSGGQDDKGIIWDVATTLSTQVDGFKDSVVAAKFNCNSTLVALADMSGNIKVLEPELWNVKFTFEVGDVNWILWHPQAENVLLCGTDSGEAWMWKLSDKNEQSKIFPSKGHSNNVAKIFDDGKRIAMGYGDGSVQIFDLKDATVLHSLSGNQAHTGTVVSLDLNSDNTLLASGSVDSTVKILSTTNFKVLLSIDCTPKQDGKEEQEEETTNSIESLVFCGKNLLTIGGLDGTFEIWDVSAKIKRNEIGFSAGIFKMLPDKNDSNRVFVGTLNEIFIVDIRSCTILDSKTQGKEQFLDFAVSSDSEFLITACEDNSLFIFHFEKL